MKRIHGLYLAVAMAATPAFAQQTGDHSQHHPGGASQAQPPSSGSSASPSPSPGSASGGGGGMMQTMMRKMPDQCRAAMQNMPSSCMPMMDKMMSGMMQGGGMQSGGMQSGGMRAGGQGAAPGSGASSGSGADAHSDHAAHAGSSGSDASAPHVSAFNEAVEKMHEPMMEGVRHENPDVAFARGMVPHHQAAIDMALVVLKYGKDEKMRKLALDVIREQNREIAEMNEWLRLNLK